MNVTVEGQSQVARIQDFLAEIAGIELLEQTESFNKIITELQSTTLTYQQLYNVLQSLLAAHFRHPAYPEAQKQIFLAFNTLFARELDRIEGLNLEALPADDSLYAGFVKNYDHYVRSYVSERRLIKLILNNALSVHNSPHYIIALQKSGSSVFGDSVSTLIANHKQKDSNWRSYPAWWGVKQDCAFNDWDLRPEIGAEPILRDGGIYKGHIEPNGKNLAVLDMYPESRYVLWFRDPRDIIASVFCEVLKKKNHVLIGLYSHSIHRLFAQMQYMKVLII